MGRGARGVAAGSGAPRWRLVWSAAAKSFQLLRHRPVSVRPSGDLARGPLLVAGRVCCSAWTARGTLNPLWEAALQKQDADIFAIHLAAPYVLTSLAPHGDR